MTEPAGQVVACRYRLRSILGRGGMGRVWPADDEVLRRPVAVKQVLLNDRHGSGSARTQAAAWTSALAEARAAARIDHVGVVKIHDIVEENLLDGGQAAPTSDLYSLGATLFAAVEGRPPFGGDSLLATHAAIANDAPAPFLRAGPLRPVIEGLLAKDPGRRMNAGQARAALQAIQCERG